MSMEARISFGRDEGFGTAAGRGRSDSSGSDLSGVESFDDLRARIILIAMNVRISDDSLFLEKNSYKFTALFNYTRSEQVFITIIVQQVDL